MANETDPLDLSKLFKWWEQVVLKLIGEANPTERNPIRNRDMWINTNKHLPDGKSIGRISVLFFLHKLREDGWLASRQQTGRGGHHDVFWMTYPMDEYIDKKIQSLKGSVKDE